MPLAVKALDCPACLQPMRLEASGQRYADGQPKRYWCCRPCKLSGRANKAGGLLGQLADARTRRARKRAHIALDRLWQGSWMTRDDAYQMVADLMGLPDAEAHIGRFDGDQCHRLIRSLRNLCWD